MKEYFITENGEQKGPFALKDLKYQTVLPDTMIWKDGWPSWRKAEDAATEFPEIDLIINDTTPPPSPVYTSALAGNQGESQEQEIDNTSWMQRIYVFAGEHIDMWLENKKDKIGNDFFFTKMHAVRQHYLGLSEVRKRSYSFFVTCAVILLISLPFCLFSWDLTPLALGLTIVWFWAAYSVLYQIKFIDKPLNGIVNTVVLFTSGFLPRVARNMIAGVVKFLLFTIVLYLTNASLWLALIHIGYRAVIAFVNPDKIPSFETQH